MRHEADAKARKLGQWLVATLFAAMLPWASGHAETLPPAARAEIDALLLQLAASGCQFKRNGSWHTAGEARAHLLKKLEYLIDKHAVASTEQFIERAATRSSMSGRAYSVKCGDAAARPSGEWLAAELRALRTRRPERAASPVESPFPITRDHTNE